MVDSGKEELQSILSHEEEERLYLSLGNRRKIWKSITSNSMGKVQKISHLDCMEKFHMKKAVDLVSLCFKRNQVV